MPRTSSQDRDQGGYYPKLGRIREDRERERDSDQDARRRTSSIDRERDRGRDREKPRDRTRTSRRIVPAEDLGIGGGQVYRRNVRYRSGNSALLQRQLNSIANASLASVLSSLTNVSGASSGSNKTITQDSYDRGDRHRKKKSRSRRREENDTTSTSYYYPPTRRRGQDVFEYMEGDIPLEYRVDHRHGPVPAAWPERAASASGNEASEGSPQMEPKSVASRRDSATRMDKTNSDSGISMRESTPEPPDKASPVARHDSAIESNVEKEVENDSSSGSDDDDDDDGTQPTDVSQYQVGPHDEDLHLREQLQEKEEEVQEHILQSPQPRRFTSFTRPHYDVQPGFSNTAHYQDNPYSLQHSYTYPPLAPRPSMNGSARYPPYYQPYPQYSRSSRRASWAEDRAPDPPSKTTIAGYELLASKLSEKVPHSGAAESEEQVTPLYRRFEFLNHRILLHLQDEIAEMEEELRRTDEAIAQQHLFMQSSAHTETAKSPKELAPKIIASRREDARIGGELCERRTMLLGRIYNKLEQYNKAMASYTTAMTSLDPAAKAELRSYRSWMDANAPVDKAETRFLEFDADLVSVSRRGQYVPPTSPDCIPACREARQAVQSGNAARMTFGSSDMKAFAIVSGPVAIVPILAWLGVPQWAAQLVLLAGPAMLMSYMRSRRNV